MRWRGWHGLWLSPWFLAPSLVRFLFERRRINGDALFEENGRFFDGHNGGGFANTNGGIAM